MGSHSGCQFNRSVYPGNPRSHGATAAGSEGAKLGEPVVEEPRDPDRAAAEWRRDVERFVASEAVSAAVAPSRLELPPVSGIRYIAFVDPSGGSQDAMTLAVAHATGEVLVLDAVREVRSPFSPEAVVSEFAALLATYSISTVTGDRYGGVWPVEVFRKAGGSPTNPASAPRARSTASCCRC
jgi:hypothetical protein